MRNQAQDIIARLQGLADPRVAAQTRRFFKTGKGEYGEGDQFLGIRVPVLRKCIPGYREQDLETTLELLRSPWHEARLLALLILVANYQRSTHDTSPASVYRAYLQHTRYINNWDLVDSSAPQIVGGHLLTRSRKPLYRLAGSEDLWERRIAILATFHFIRQGEFTDTLALADRLLEDREDLMHKAVGWMLREVGNRDRTALEDFLDTRYASMPRTMLRYAIEKFTEAERQDYLRGTK